MNAPGSADMMNALIALGAGGAIGVMAAWMLRREADSTRPAGDSIADVEERLAHCIAQLRDLDEQRGRLTPDGYAAQKADFEARAAELLRTRDALVKDPKKVVRKKAEDPASLSPTMRFFAERPQLRGALWGGGTVAVFALLYVLVTAEEHPREGPMTGGIPAGARGPMQGGGPGGGGSSDNEELQKLMRDITQDPNSVPNLLRMAHLLLKNQMHAEARVVNDRAMALQPSSMEGQVHRAVLLAAEGHGEQAIRNLTDLVQQDPKLAEAWFFRGMLSMQAGLKPQMVESFKQFVAVAPDGPQKERIKAMLQAQGGM